MEKVAVIGYGYVGKAMAELLKDHYEVCVYDPFIDVLPEETSSGIMLQTKETINKECKLAVVCVPTEPNEDDSCNTSIVKESIEWLETELILIKSTVPPTTTKKLINATGKNVVFSPEYIGEGKYFTPPWKYPHPTDMKQHDFMILGGEKEARSAVWEYFKPIFGVCAKVMLTDSTTAEMVKYMVNTWGSTKVTWANEMFEIAQAFGVEYDELREGFLLDSRAERIHTAVFKKKRGFGGKCFPKDVKAIVEASKEAGYDPSFLKEVLSSNDKFNKLNG